jgi:ATP-grasp domain, R2K clade family 3
MIFPAAVVLGPWPTWNPAWNFDGWGLWRSPRVTLMPAPVLYCSDPLNPRRADDHFAAEARAVRERGGVVALIDHDALLRGDVEGAVARVPLGLGTAWYRGWMIPSDLYAVLARGLEQRGAGLVVGPEQYRSAHELPGWYPLFAEVTPVSTWTVGAAGEVPEEVELAALTGTLRPGPGIVKDYVKSRKHEWEQACFIPDLSDTAGVARIVRRFVELQGEFLVGGIVLREFESFVAPDSVASEVRVWWVDGQARLVTPHPDSKHRESLVPELGHVEAAVRTLSCRFVTTDVALRADGVWRVVEVGDGQVSDLHASIDPGDLVDLLLAA